MCTKGQSANLKCSSRDAMPPFYASPRAPFGLFNVVFCARSLKELRAGSGLGGETVNVRSVCLLSRGRERAGMRLEGFHGFPLRTLNDCVSSPRLGYRMFALAPLAQMALAYICCVVQACLHAHTQYVLAARHHSWFPHLLCTAFRSATCPRRRLFDVGLSMNVFPSVLRHCSA